MSPPYLERANANANFSRIHAWLSALQLPPAAANLLA
jgi:hypothetical protein